MTTTTTTATMKTTPRLDQDHYTLRNAYGTWINRDQAQSVACERANAHLHPRIPILHEIRAVLFDLDGTLVAPVLGTEGNGQGFPLTPDDRRPIPGVRELCAELTARGIMLGIATNQGGVAFGHGTPYTVLPAIVGIAQHLGISAVAACWSHPQATHNPELWRIAAADDRMRKPNMGMLLWLLQDGLHILPRNACYVGDREEDYLAACRVPGLQFHDADAFRATILAGAGHTPDDLEPDPDADPEGWLAWSSRQPTRKAPVAAPVVAESLRVTPPSSTARRLASASGARKTRRKRVS